MSKRVAWFSTTWKNPLPTLWHQTFRKFHHFWHLSCATSRYRWAPLPFCALIWELTWWVHNKKTENRNKSALQEFTRKTFYILSPDEIFINCTFLLSVSLYYNSLSVSFSTSLWHKNKNALILPDRKKNTENWEDYLRPFFVLFTKYSQLAAKFAVIF